MSIQHKITIAIILSLQLFLGCGGSNHAIENKPNTTISICNNYIVNVSDFGAIGDGVHDDYTSIMDAVESINNQGFGTLVFEKKVYRINQHRIDGGSEKNDIKNIIFKNLSCLSIQGNGAIIDVDGNWTRVADKNNSKSTSSYHNSIGMHFLESNNITIENLTLDGNADKTTKEATAEGKSHGLDFSSCKNVNIDNVYIHHYQADGLYIGTTTQKDTNGNKMYVQSKHFVVQNSKFTNNARQGCTISQLRDANFTNCIFSHSGKTGLYGGHSPQSGVDIEPNYSTLKDNLDDDTGDVIFTNCIFSDNTGFEYVGSNATSTPYPINFNNCSFNSYNLSDDLNYSAVLPTTKTTIFDCCIFNEVAIQPSHGVKIDVEKNIDILNSKFISKYSNHRMILVSNLKKIHLNIKENTFNFNGTHSSGAYRLYLRNAQVAFENNHIFIDKNEHNGTGQDNKFLMQKGVHLKNNFWHTNLDEPNTLFGIDYTDSSYENEFFEPKRSFKLRYEIK